MKYDKVRVILFVSTLLLLISTVVGFSLFYNRQQQVNQLETQVDALIAEQPTKSTEASTTESDSEDVLLTTDEGAIRSFYAIVYNYETSPQEINQTALQSITSKEVREQVQEEIEANTGGSPQQNVIQKSSVVNTDVQVLNYKSDSDTQQYLVTVPIKQVFNGTQNNYDLNQVIKVKDGIIVERTSIDLSKN